MGLGLLYQPNSMKQRSVYRVPSVEAGFLGENNRDASTESVFAQGALTELRNYHMMGKGRLRKRQGWEAYAGTNTLDGTNWLRGLAQYEFGDSNYLIGLAGSKIGKLNTSGDTPDWDDITGTLSITSSTPFPRFAMFHDGTNGCVVGTDGTNPSWYWTGTGDVSALSVTSARDVATFKQHLFLINTPDRSTAVRYSALGSVTSWPSDNIFACTRDSDGTGLTLHSSETLLAFYERSIHRINFDYGGAGAITSFFTNQLVDGSVGTKATHSIVTSRGATYFANDDGIFVITDPQQPATYISRSIEDYWGKLGHSQKENIYALERGEPWNEIVFLVTAGNLFTKHNAAIVFNTEHAKLYGAENAFSIFDNTEGDGGGMMFVVGTNYREETSNKDKTLVGMYDGVLSHAWGDDNALTSFVDGTTSVRSTIKTGMLDFGYVGAKGLREGWFDLDISAVHHFTVSVDGIDQRLQHEQGLVVGYASAILGSTFTLGSSALADDNIQQVRFKLSGKSRYFQFTLTESDATSPHTLEAMNFLYVPAGIRIR